MRPTGLAAISPSIRNRRGNLSSVPMIASYSLRGSVSPPAGDELVCAGPSSCARSFCRLGESISDGSISFPESRAASANARKRLISRRCCTRDAARIQTSFLFTPRILTAMQSPVKDVPSATFHNMPNFCHLRQHGQMTAHQRDHSQRVGLLCRIPQ